MRDRANDMKSHAQQHFEPWAKEAQRVDNASLREASLARREQSLKASDRAVEAMQRAKAAHDPFIATLKDLRSYLGIDLSEQAVKAAQPRIETARSRAKALKEDALNAEKALTEVRDEMRAVAPAKPG